MGVYAATQLGVLRALEEHDMAPTVLAGVGAGAWIAGLYACEPNAEAALAAMEAAARMRGKLRDISHMGIMAMACGQMSGAGLVRGGRLLALMERQTGHRMLADAPRDLIIPALALPTRRTLVFSNCAPMEDGDMVWTEQASVALAMRAAMAVPVLMCPAHWMGVPLIATQGLSAVVAGLRQVATSHVLVVDPMRQRPKPPYSLTEVAALAMSAPEGLPDLPEEWQLLAPRIPDALRPDQGGALRVCAQIGYSAMMDALPRIKRAWGDGTARQGKVLPFCPDRS